jgi:hypothetical protein
MRAESGGSSYMDGRLEVEPEGLMGKEEVCCSGLEDRSSSISSPGFAAAASAAWASMLAVPLNFSCCSAVGSCVGGGSLAMVLNFSLFLAGGYQQLLDVKVA